MKKNLWRVCIAGIVLAFGALGIASGAKAKQSENWLNAYEAMRSEMEQEVDPLMRKEVTTEKKSDLDEEEQKTSLASYDIKNAIPYWILKADYSLVSDYKKADKKFSDIMQWDGWYIPGRSLSGEYAVARVRKVDGEYHVAVLYGLDESLYMAKDMNDIKKTVEKKFGSDVAEVRAVDIPFYRMSLLYVQTSDGKEYVLPYEAEDSDTLKNLGIQSGKKYKASKFVSCVDNTYEEYTMEELKKMNAKDTYGGEIEPKLKEVSSVSENNNSGFIVGIIAAAAVVVIGLIAFFLVKKRETEA